MKKKYVAGVYARVSVSESNCREFSTSIINQKAIIDEYSINNSIEIYDYYIDDGYSGGNFDRPSFNRMIKDIKNGLINCVITKDISRLGRDFIGTGNYIYKFFPDNGIRYIAILDNFDTENPTINDDYIPFKTVINDMYLKDTSKKIKSSRHKLMQKGYYVGSTIPYGYKRSSIDSRILEIDPYSSSIVKRIYLMRERGMSTSAIARILTNDNVLPPDVYNNKNNKCTLLSNVWKASTVSYILSNKVYLGILTQRKYERVSLKSKRKILTPEDTWIVVKSNHPAIIDSSLFYSVNNKEKNNSIRLKKYDYLFKGLVKCEDCLSTMLVRRLKKTSGDTAIYCCRTYAKYRNGTCSMHYFREDVLNSLVIDKVRRLFNSVEKKKIINICNKVISNCEIYKTIDNELNSIRKKINEFENIIINLYKDRAEGIINSHEFAVIKKSVDAEIETLNSKEKQLINKRESLNITPNYLVDKLINFEGYNKFMFSKIINMITIDNNKVVRIYYKFGSIN